MPEVCIDSFRGDYDFLSNFYACMIEYKGVWYQSAEAAFQAQKCMNEEDKQVFCGLPAAKAKRRGRQIVEGNTWGDAFWGVDSRTGEGENHLGQILMQVRSELNLSNKGE